ncbi:MAG: hypothetical protein RLZZ293_1492 [Pseudomonadota bacterium]|jgi:DNA-binding NtrC family response regulator
MDKLILIVDDELGIRELLRECLEDEGYIVKLAENALEADKIVKEHRFDLILMDVWLPDMDGVSLFKRFLSNGITSPVIMMSGHASITSALEAIRIGARDFLEKPLSLSKLLPLVDKHVLKEETNDLGIIEDVSEIITLDLNDQLKTIKETLERRYFIYHMNKYKSNITKIAEASGVDRAHLYRKFKTLGIKIK